jgi:hypothetical protein
MNKSQDGKNIGIGLPLKWDDCDGIYLSHNALIYGGFGYWLVLWCIFKQMAHTINNKLKYKYESQYFRR